MAEIRRMEWLKPPPPVDGGHKIEPCPYALRSSRRLPSIQRLAMPGNWARRASAKTGPAWSASRLPARGCQRHRQTPPFQENQTASDWQMLPPLAMILLYSSVKKLANPTTDPPVPGSLPIPNTESS